MNFPADHFANIDQLIRHTNQTTEINSLFSTVATNRYKILFSNVNNQTNCSLNRLLRSGINRSLRASPMCEIIMARFPQPPDISPIINNTVDYKRKLIC